MRKTLAILLVLAMSLALLTACGSSSAPAATLSPDVAVVTFTVDATAAYASGKLSADVMGKLANNGLAALSEHYGSYAFYEVDVWLKSVSALVIALLTWQC